MGKQSINKPNWRTILEEATAAVYVDNKMAGTAWLCSNNYLISAGHLFSEINKWHTITLSFNESLKDDQEPLRYDAELIICKNDCIDGTDFAVLKLNSPIARKSLPISTNKLENSGQEIISYGYGTKCSGSATGRVVGTHCCK